MPRAAASLSADEEADAPHVEGQAVGVLAQQRHRRHAVALEDARRERRRHAVALQEHHHLAHLALRVPGVANDTRPRRTDARHLADAPRIAVQQLQGLDAEALDDARRQLGADALHQARAQVLANALQRRGRQLGEPADPELRAKARRVLAPARHAQPRADRHAQQATDDGQRFGRAIDGQLGRRESAPSEPANTMRSIVPCTVSSGAPSALPERGRSNRSMSARRGTRPRLLRSRPSAALPGACRWCAWRCPATGRTGACPRRCAPASRE